MGDRLRGSLGHNAAAQVAALGLYNGKPHGHIHRSEDFSMGGVMIGTGAAISAGERWYVRPQARLALMTSGNIAGFLNVGLGYRF